MRLPYRGRQWWLYNDTLKSPLCGSSLPTRFHQLGCRIIGFMNRGFCGLVILILWMVRGGERHSTAFSCWRFEGPAWSDLHNPKCERSQTTDGHDMLWHLFVKISKSDIFMQGHWSDWLVTSFFHDPQLRSWGSCDPPLIWTRSTQSYKRKRIGTLLAGSWSSSF